MLSQRKLKKICRVSEAWTRRSLFLFARTVCWQMQSAVLAITYYQRSWGHSFCPTEVNCLDTLLKIGQTDLRNRTHRGLCHPEYISVICPGSNTQLYLFQSPNMGLFCFLLVNQWFLYLSEDLPEALLCLLPTPTPHPPPPPGAFPV